MAAYYERISAPLRRIAELERGLARALSLLDGFCSQMTGDEKAELKWAWDLLRHTISGGELTPEQQSLHDSAEADVARAPRPRG